MWQFPKPFLPRRVTLSALASLVLTLGALTGSALAQADGSGPETPVLTMESSPFASGGD